MTFTYMFTMKPHVLDITWSFWIRFWGSMERRLREMPCMRK